MSLKDKLENLKKQDEQWREAQSEPPGKLGEWQTSIEQLYNDIEGFLRAYQDKGFVSFSREPLHLHEDLVGPYDVKTLRIQAPGIAITLTPVGLFIVGARGRIDIRVHGRGIRSERFMLLRPIDSKEDEWLISCPPANEIKGQVVNLGPNRFVPVTKETFESAVENMLG